MTRSHLFPLSTDEFGVFFASHHHELATQLRQVSPQQFSDLANVSHRDITERLAPLCDPYRWVMSDHLAIDVRALCLVREMFGFMSPVVDAIFAASGLGAYTLMSTGEDHSALLAGYRSGDVVFGFALSEPDAGSDAASLKTLAEPVENAENAFELSGTKCLISNVSVATHYIVFATIDPAQGHRGISAFLVDASSAGLREEPIPLNTDHPIGNLHLSKCPAVQVGPSGGGFRLAMQVLNMFRPTVGAAAMGMAGRALAEAKAHVQRREQFGASLASTQLVQTQLAEMSTDFDAARLLVLRAAHACDHDRGRPSWAAKAKWFATEAAQRIVDRSVQLLGGQGVVAGSAVERLYRAVRPLRVYEGTTEIQKLIIGRDVIRE